METIEVDTENFNLLQRPGHIFFQVVTESLESWLTISHSTSRTHL